MAFVVLKDFFQALNSLFHLEILKHLYIMFHHLGELNHGYHKICGLIYVCYLIFLACFHILQMFRSSFDL